MTEVKSDNGKHGKISASDLLKTATARTGLDDFGPPDFREGLEVLIESLNTEVNIPDDRRRYVEQRLLRLLMNRLWFAKDLAEHPEIRQEDLGSPVIISALPRTGSTKLHRMLGASKGFQTLNFWQVNMPARIPGLADGGRARRIQETRDFEQWMYAVSPGMLTGHPMFTDEAEEDHWLMEETFRHTISFALFTAVKHIQWVLQADRTPVYDYFIAQLKYLQWQFKGQTQPQTQLHLQPQVAHPWLLKAPGHFGDEPFLSKIFNKPRFIVTHRDPAMCIASAATTGAAIQKMYSGREVSSELGAGVLDLFSNLAFSHVKWRDSNPDVDVLDLDFREVSEDGIGTARKVYEFLDIAWTPAAEQGVLDWERDNPKNKHGKGVFSAAAIGMTDEHIRGAFKPYIERYSKFI